jgi:hypothetical protein
MPDTTSLFDPPLYKSFTADSVGRRVLQADLDQMFRGTRIVNPGAPREIRLNPATRTTQTGFRYTSMAFSRVCRALAPGLSNLINNISGPVQHDAAGRESYSTPTACAVFNQIVDLRFQTVLVKSQMVVDEERRIIEGLLGPKTHYLENSSLLDLVETALVDCCGAVFAGATLAGRRMFVRYLRPEIVATPQGEYRYGYALSATESGDDSIRTYLLYQHTGTGHSCLETPAGGLYRQRRTGSKFLEQIKRLVIKLTTAKFRDFNLGLMTLSDSLLFPSTDPRAIDLVAAKWCRNFKLAGMPGDIANAVMARIATIDMTDMQSRPSLLNLAELTMYDLFMAAMAAGQGRGQRVRELTERAAFWTFFGEEA